MNSSGLLKRSPRSKRGFALIITITLMLLLALLAVGMLGLASIELRKAGGSPRATAMANARLGLSMALAELQAELGDDRRATANAEIFDGTARPSAVGVWDGWSTGLAENLGRGGRARVDYDGPKSDGFRRWLVSSADPEATRELDWHESAAAAEQARLFTSGSSGFDLGGGKVALDESRGTYAWAISGENSKARLNLGIDDSRRTNSLDRHHAPARPHLGLSPMLEHPEGDAEWVARAASITGMPQLVLDEAYGVDADSLAAVNRHFSAHARSLLTNPVEGGLKVDLSTGFELDDSDFAADQWSDAAGTVENPFRGGDLAAYKGQVPIHDALTPDAEAQVNMNFPPATVNHRYQVNGVATFDTLRAHYRSYRHLYLSGGLPAAFERTRSHVATPRTVPGRPFGRESQPGLSPVLDRMNLMISIFAKQDGTLGILLSPLVTLWNPYDVALETEGVVVYPWVDLAVFWNWSVTARSGRSPGPYHSSLSRFVGEGYQGHGRSSRPYFYLHLTESGQPPRRGSDFVSPPIRLEPGEVRVFGLADPARRDLEIRSGARNRTWQMRPVSSASDLTSTLEGGIVLNMTKSINNESNFDYKLQPGDTVNSNTVSFDRNTFYYIVGMADAYQIRNPQSELMVEARPGASGLPSLPEEPNLHFLSQILAGPSFGKSQDSFRYPSFRFEEIRERPQLVGSLLTYHRVARSSSLGIADLAYTTNPRQPYINPFVSNANFQTGPHYESLLQGGTSLTQLAMQTSFDGRRAFYGPSHSAADGLSQLPFFEVPRTPILSLGGLQHCDISSTAFTVANQVGNSWASPYLASDAGGELVRQAPDGTRINPGLGTYDYSFLANETLFDGYYFSGAVPEFGSPTTGGGNPDVWNDDQVVEIVSVDDVIEQFFRDPTLHPLRQPRMSPYAAGLSFEQLDDRLTGPARSVRLAGHLLVEGGFNVNSTSVEAWTAVLASLRGAPPVGGDRTPAVRLRDPSSGVAENDPWSGFRTLDDGDIRELAENIVEEVRRRGPFLSLGEFVNRRVDRRRDFASTGAIQAAIDETAINRDIRFDRFNPRDFPQPSNIPDPNTGVNTPSWLSQADLLQALAPTITTRSDTFTIRSQGEATDSNGRVLARVILEAVVQRVPEWVDPTDDIASPIEALESEVNRTFGRRFEIVGIRELRLDSEGDPI